MSVAKKWFTPTTFLNPVSHLLNTSIMQTCGLHNIIQQSFFTIAYTNKLKHDVNPSDPSLSFSLSHSTKQSVTM